LSRVIELLRQFRALSTVSGGFFVFRLWVRDYFEAPISSYVGALPVFQGTPFGLDILTAGLILAIMIIPTISSISKDVMMAVPSSQREAAYSLGATRWEVVRTGVWVCSSGIFGAIILDWGEPWERPWQSLWSLETHQVLQLFRPPCSNRCHDGLGHSQRVSARQSPGPCIFPR